MLILVSDLHFVDETAGKHNLSPKAYHSLWEDFNILRRFRTGRIKEVVFVFLGDVFDVIRSQNWFHDVTEGDRRVRPWGSVDGIEPPDSTSVLDKTRAVLRQILTNPAVRDTCRIFRSWKRRLTRAHIPVEYHFIPGNHDRFLHLDADSRREVIQALSLDDDAAQGFSTRFRNARYPVVAFHGHEIDLYNFGRFSWQNQPFAAAAFGAPSMGEAITIDIVSRIPFLAAERLGNSSPARAAHQALQDVDNIRPVQAVFSYLSSLAGAGDAPLHQGLDAVVRTAFQETAQMPFVHQWGQEVDQRWVPADASLITRMGARLLDVDFDEYLAEVDGVGKAEEILTAAAGTDDEPAKRWQKLKSHPYWAELMADAGPLIRQGRCYFVCGHTHVPWAVPISTEGSEIVLFNTGTFRPRVIQCAEPGKGFVAHKAMSYLVFYREDEEVEHGKQEYELWEGQLRER